MSAVAAAGPLVARRTGLAGQAADICWGNIDPRHRGHTGGLKMGDDNMRSTPTSLGMAAKIFLWVAGILGAFTLVEFFFHGRAVDDPLKGVGFLLIAYGTYRNDFGLPRDAAGELLPVDAGGRLASVLGIGLVAAALIIEAGR